MLSKDSSRADLEQRFLNQAAAHHSNEIQNIELDLDLYFLHQAQTEVYKRSYHKRIDVLCEKLKQRTSEEAHIPISDELSLISSPQ